MELELGTNNQHISLGHEYSEERTFWLSVTQQYIVHPAVRPWPLLRRLEDVTACALPCWVAVVVGDGILREHETDRICSLRSVIALAPGK